MPELCPAIDLDWDLLRLGNRDQIDAVFVDGALRLWRGAPVDWDARALVDELREIATRAIAAAPIQRIHPHAAADRAMPLARLLVRLPYRVPLIAISQLVVVEKD